MQVSKLVSNTRTNLKNYSVTSSCSLNGESQGARSTRHLLEQIALTFAGGFSVSRYKLGIENNRTSPQQPLQ